MEPHHRAVICRLRLSSGDRSLPRACTLVSSWVQEGSVEGSGAAEGASCRTRGPDEDRTRETASGQDAGPTRPIECCRGPRGGRSRWKSRRPSRPGPRRGARAAAGLRPYLDPSFQNNAPPSQPAQHNEDTSIFWFKTELGSDALFPK